MKLMTTYFLLAGLLTGVSLEGAEAGDAARGDCPPPPPGGPFFMQHFDGGPMPRGNRVFMATPLFEFDLDKDGRTTRAEIDQALRARFDVADVNHDGVLDPLEFETVRPRLAEGMPPRGTMGPGPEGRDGQPDPAQMFRHLDWNLDGELSFEEFAAPVRQMALRLDRNGDGVIDADELRAPPGFAPPGFVPPPGPPPREW